MGEFTGDNLSGSRRECLLTVLNEEYGHRQFAERDLDALGKAPG